MYLYWLYLKNICYKPSSYACKWSFLVQAGAGLWAKCTREPRAYSTSAVLPLPFVNMDPSKLSTMCTCILLPAEQRKKCVWYCTTIKFDLSLEKTREMVLVEGQLTLLSGVNIRLGGFHYSLSDRHNCGAGAHVFWWCHSWVWHISVKSDWTYTTHLSEDRLFSHLSRVVLLASVAVNCHDALLLQKVPPVAKKCTSCRSKCEDCGESAGWGRLHKY